MRILSRLDTDEYKNHYLEREANDLAKEKVGKLSEQAEVIIDDLLKEFYS